MTEYAGSNLVSDPMAGHLEPGTGAQMWVCPFNVNGKCDLPHDDCFCGLPWIHADKKEGQH